MKFELNDKVVVKQTNDDGIIREIINDKMVMVEVRGVRFPAHTDHLDFPYFKMFSKPALPVPAHAPKKYLDDIKKEKIIPKFQVKPGVWLLFFPVYAKDVFGDEVVETLKIYLVNQISMGLKFHFWLRMKGVLDMEMQNEVTALSDFYLMNIDFEQLNDGPSFDFEFSLLGNNPKLAEYFEASYKPKAKQVFKLVGELQENGDGFFSQLLFENYPGRRDVLAAIPDLVSDHWSLDKLAGMGFKVVKEKRLKEPNPPPPSVIDLHIEKLTDDYRHLSAHEKLVFQLNELEKYLDQALLHYLKQVHIIHGVGTGRLKEEIHEKLKLHVGVKNFVHQYHAWFGYGATEVNLV